MIWSETISVRQNYGFGLMRDYSYESDMRCAGGPDYYGAVMPEWMFHWARVHGVRPDDDNLDEGQQGRP